jgi:hypothetical protein
MQTLGANRSRPIARSSGTYISSGCARCYTRIRGWKVLKHQSSVSVHMFLDVYEQKRKTFFPLSGWISCVLYNAEGCSSVIEWLDRMTLVTCNIAGIACRAMELMYIYVNKDFIFESIMLWKRRHQCACRSLSLLRAVYMLYKYCRVRQLHLLNVDITLLYTTFSSCC